MTSKLSALQLHAGPTALKHIQTHGLNADDFTVMVGASGGPKWFSLFGLDKYVFGEFFKDRTRPLQTLGTSAGAWRMACFGQNQPVAAISRLAEAYSTETYSEKPDAKEISTKARVILSHLLNKSGAHEVVNNPVIKTHIIADRCKGLVASERLPLQLTGLALSAFANTISRKSLGAFYHRVIFHNQHPHAFPLTDLPTTQCHLTEQNIKDVLMASGSIPVVLEGVKEISGAPEGVYRDGGITDYHFDIPFTNEGLVFYPHFYSKIIPGWFDKQLKWRKPNLKHYDNALILSPSPEWVAKLPYGKIPDRNDFKHLDATTRIKYWQTVLQASDQLAEDLDNLINSPELLNNSLHSIAF